VAGGAQREDLEAALQRAIRRALAVLRRSLAPIDVVLPGPGDVIRGKERGVPLGLRPEAGVFENVPLLVDMRLLRSLQLVGPWRRRLQESADVERGSRAEKGGRRRRCAGPIPVGVVVVWAVDVVLAGTGDDRERVWGEDAILLCVVGVLDRCLKARKSSTDEIMQFVTCTIKEVPNPRDPVCSKRKVGRQLATPSFVFRAPRSLVP